MLNLSDNELDRLSRDASEHYKAPPVQSLWEKLSRRLDEEMPQEKKYRRRIVWLALMLLLLAGGAGYYFSQTGKVSTGVQQAQERSASVVTDKSREIKATDNKPSAEIHKVDDKGSPIAEDIAHKQKKTQISQEEFIPGKKNINVDNKSSDKTEKNDRSVRKKYGPLLGIGKRNEPFKKNLNTPPVAFQLQNPLKVTDRPYQEIKATAPAAIAPKTDINEKLSLKDENQDKLSKSKNKKPIPPVSLRKWEFGVVYSPDLSNVKFSHSDKTGINAGITIGYNFNRRWSVNTGLIYTKKNYTTSGDNYKFPPDYWASSPNVKMEQVEAVCTMFDIPLNVRYNWLANRNNSAFISAGLSSYLMNKEEFGYHYTYYNDPYYREWTNSNSSNYLFSIANISLGYEYQVNPSISLQAEPFFKFSLSEVGFGNVELNSFGMFIGVKYKPLFGKNSSAKSKASSQK